MFDTGKVDIDNFSFVPLHRIDDVVLQGISQNFLKVRLENCNETP